MPDHSCLIDDFGPLPVVRPQSVAELCGLVRQAAAEGQALYPLGGRTMLDYGLPPSKRGHAVEVRALDQVIDYPARDMTITVQAGILMDRLQALLAAENQRLPIDVPRSEEATLGGILATNTSGPCRYGHGTLRDYVLGISAVNDEGKEIKAGGRVVKNVAGYDLCKLLVGSLGTLGIITQATLKLRPRAEEQALVCLACPTEMLGALLDKLHASRTRPVCLDVLNLPALEALPSSALPAQPRTPWMAFVGFEGNAEAVKWQVQQLIKELGPGWAMEARLAATALPTWHALAEFPAWPPAKLTFKATLLPHAAAGFCRDAAALPEHPRLQAHAGNGIIVGHVAGELTMERAVGLVQSLRQLAAGTGGSVVVSRCPAPWKHAVSVWGSPRGDVALMRTVKDKLDPRRLFNPGRFVDGI